MKNFETINTINKFKAIATSDEQISDERFYIENIELALGIKHSTRFWRGNE